MKHNRFIPVYQGGLITADTAVLAQIGQDVLQNAYVTWFERSTFLHPPGCSCCLARPPVSHALSALFRARVTGSAPFFSQVVVLADQEGWKDVVAALTHDAVTSARFKLAHR